MKRPAGLPSSLLLAVLAFCLARPPAYAALPAVPLTAAVLTGAGEGPSIAVVTVALDPKSKGRLGALEQAAAEALVRAERFVLVPGADAFDPRGAEDREAQIAVAQQRLKDGQKALDDLDNQKATEAYVAALVAWRKTNLGFHFEDLVNAWVLKAAGHSTGGETALAKQDIEKIITIAPRANFPTQFFPPELLKYADQQRKLAREAKGTLTISTEPAGARVWVDGVFRGTSPVTATELMGGKHVVVASLAGYQTAVLDALPGEETLKLEAADLLPALNKARDAVAKDPEGPGRDLALKALGKQLKVDQVLAVLVRKAPAGDKLELLALRLEVKDGHSAGFAQGPVPSDDADALAKLLDGVVTRDAARQGGPVTHYKGGAGGTRTMVAYGLLGASALALASGIFFGVQAGAQADAFHKTIQTQTGRTANLKAAGQGYAVVADVSYGVALLTGAAGAVLGFTRVGQGGGGDEEAPRASKRGTKRGQPDGDAQERRTRDVDEGATKKDEDRARDDQKQRDADRAREDDKRREEDRKRDEASRKKDEEQKKKDEAARKKEEEQRKKDDEARKREEEQRAAEEKKKQEEADRKAKAEAGKKKTKKQLEEEARLAREEEEKRAAEEAKKKREEDEKRRKEEAERKKKEEDAKKKKDEDHDDLRNF